MNRCFICIATIMLLFLGHWLNAMSQTADSSIFSKPLKIDAAVKTERAPRSEQKGDTVVFNAAAYQVIENSDSERLLSKMPGIVITEKGIEAHGREVSRILLDGQEFFGNDVLTAIHNIPADMVKLIEVFNRLSEAALLTGVDDGEGYQAINIVTKRKKGTGMTSGRVYGSYGVSDSEDHRHNYIAGGNVTHITDKRTISVIGMSNNINKFNFTSSDILSGVTGMDASSGNTFKVKSMSGISDVHSLGASYNSKKCNFSYFFNDIDNTGRPSSDKYTMTNTEGKEQHTHSGTDNTTNNMNHKFEGKFRINPGKRHAIVLTPSVSFNLSDYWKNEYGHYSYVFRDAADQFLRKQNNKARNDKWTVRGSLNAYYRYNFKKRKRSLTASARYGFYRHSSYDRTQEYRWKLPDSDTTDLSTAYYSYLQHRDRDVIQHSATGKLTFTEPISKRSFLSAEYIFTMTDTEDKNLVFPFADGEYSKDPKTRVSAINHIAFYHNKAGIRYNYAFKKYTVAATLAYQNTIYSGHVTLPDEGYTERSYHHPMYNITAYIPFNKSNSLRIEAKSRTQNPGNNMLRNIVDRSSTSNVRAGNPNLTPAYIHSGEIRYINTNKKAGTTLSLSASYAGSNNYFCDSLVINNPDFIVMIDDNGKPIKLGEGNQFVKPVNLKGYHKISLRGSFSMPVDFLRSNFNVTAHASLLKLPGMINGEKIPIDRNWMQISGRLDSNISKEIDFTLSYSFRYTMNDYNGKFGPVKNNYFTHQAKAQLKWIFIKDFTFTGAFLYKNYRNTEGRYNDHFYYCDLFIGKRFLQSKRLEVSAGVNDLFNNNVRYFWHTISASGRTDGSNIGIGRYFSLQVIWHFR